MIVVDTSALMAILLGEPEAEACASKLATDGSLLISAATVAEALIVASRRGLSDEMGQMLGGLGFEIVDVTPASARRVAAAYDRWGQGVHAASLNLGDCFAYELARERSAPLLFVGADFGRTDVAVAL